MPDIDVQIADVPQPVARKRGRPPGSKNAAKPPVKAKQETVAVKQQPAKKPAAALLDKQDIIDLVTTPHNILSKVLRLDALAIEDDAVAPYAADIAQSLNKGVPSIAKQTKEKLPWLSVVAFFGLVEAPTLINTYDEIRAKQRKGPQQVITNTAHNDTHMPGAPGPTPPGHSAMSQLDRLNAVHQRIENGVN